MSTINTSAKRESTAPALLNMSGTYTVAPGTTQQDLHDDMHCWLESVRGLIDLVIDGLQEEDGQIAGNPRIVASALQGAVLQLEMAQGALSAAQQLHANGVAA